MTRSFTRAAVLTATLLTATPALAFGGPDGGAGMMRGHGDRDGGRGMWGGTFGALTPEGRKILGDAMRDGRAENRDEIGAARDRMLEILGADRLDVNALRRAMQDEQRLAAAQQQRHQDAMLGAFQKLSPRDRKAFAVSMRAQQFKMEQMRKDAQARMAKWRDRRGEPMAPPPPPSAPGK